MAETQYVLSISYGKDSLACLGAIEQLGLPLDRIIHSEVWATDDIPADPPPMVEFKAKADQIIKERWGIEVEHLCAMKDGEKLTYEKLFYHVPNRRKPKRNNDDWGGRPKGFPLTLGAWCKHLKTQLVRIPNIGQPRELVYGTQNRGQSWDSQSFEGTGVPAISNEEFFQSSLAQGADISIVQYLGIAADEPERIERHTKAGVILPLVKIGWTEADCRKWCEENGLLSPIYTTASRGGCWFCHNQGVEQLRLLRKTYPDLWALLLKWDKDSPTTFHADGHTVHDFDKRFRAEDWGLVPTDRKFRWKMISGVIPILDNLYVFDCEVFAFDWVFVFTNVHTGEHTVMHNDNEAVMAFMREKPLIAGYNNKDYDQFILKAVLVGMTPEEIKRVNDLLIEHELTGWNIPELRDCGVYLDQFDLMDDTQQGTGLKDIEGHLGMNIQETTVDFTIDRPLTEEELQEVIDYCKHDVRATHILLQLRQTYVNNKLTLGREKGLEPAKALYMTNAKLTAAYLDASMKEHDDEREYVFPDDILWEYIPDKVREFFDRIHDMSIPSEVLFKQMLDIMVGECKTRLAWGGIHGAIPHYREETKDGRQIKNADVGSYYPHLMTIDGYYSRNIPSVEVYEAMLNRRMAAKKSGDTALANALKLVANTTYGAMLNQYNDLYDPLQGLSVCITGQLRLLELANHLLAECPTLKVIQLNTDGIMCSFDDCDAPMWDAILKEWQERTKFTLEEDLIKMICQKDVNNYVEVPFKGSPKIKGGVLVRGVVTNGNVDFEALGFPKWENLFGGAFKINNNAVIVSKAVVDCIAYGTPVEETIMGSTNILDFQLIAKTWQKCGRAVHEEYGQMVEVQRVNRVYAVESYEFGTLYMVDPATGSLRKVSGLPAHCVVDNENRLSLEAIDRDWYIRLAKRYVKDFLGKKARRNGAVTRKINKKKKELLAMLGVGE